MHLKNRIALVFVSFIGIIIFSTIAYTSNNGKAAKTGSPGENACNECHSTNALNSGGGSVTISSPDLTNWAYVPGMTYTINVRVKKTGVGKFGFGFEALLPSGANAGLISTVNSSNAKTLSATVLGNSRANAVHKQPNHFGTDSVTFSFVWTAPAAGTGNVMFYAAGNATNSGNNSSGDFIYTANQSVSEVLTTNLNEILTSKIVTIFPNPIVDLINISLPNNLQQKTTAVKIFDLKGNELLNNELSGELLSVKLSEIAEKINQGVYIVRIENGEWNYQEKVIITK